MARRQEQSFYDVLRARRYHVIHACMEKNNNNNIIGVRGFQTSHTYTACDALPNNFFISCHVAVFSLARFVLRSSLNVGVLENLSGLNFFPCAAPLCFLPVCDIYHFPNSELFGTCV
jgi:hypothetical protein